MLKMQIDSKASKLKHTNFCKLFYIWDNCASFKNILCWSNFETIPNKQLQTKNVRTYSIHSEVCFYWIVA